MSNNSLGRREAVKRRVNRLVDVWLNQVTSVSNDAGWDGDSILARVIEYGYLLPPTGNDQSNAAMIAALSKLRGTHALYPICRAIIVGSLKERSHLVLPVLAVRYYVGQNEITKKPFDNVDRMKILGMSANVFYSNLQRGYDYLDERFRAAIAYEHSKVV